VISINIFGANKRPKIAEARKQTTTPDRKLTKARKQTITPDKKPKLIRLGLQAAVSKVQNQGQAHQPSATGLFNDIVSSKHIKSKKAIISGNLGAYNMLGQGQKAARTNNLKSKKAGSRATSGSHKKERSTVHVRIETSGNELDRAIKDSQWTEISKNTNYIFERSSLL
jgi:hypothetical protein